MNYFKKITSLKNKLVFVIGGTGLIGKETIKSLIDCNSKVINLDIKKLNKNKFNEFFDCTDEKNIKKNYLNIVKKHGVPDILINCSYPKTSEWKNNNFEKIDIKDFNLNTKNHLNSYVILSILTANLMKKKRKKGSIILLGSIYGVVGQDTQIYINTGMSENIAYSVIKGGITNFTKQMASYYGKFNIRINCICPGGVQDKINTKNKNFIKNYRKRVPLKRLAKSDEIANVILFFSSDASSYVTGNIMMVDGGWTSI